MKTRHFWSHPAVVWLAAAAGVIVACNGNAKRDESASGEAEETCKDDDEPLLCEEQRGACLGATQTCKDGEWGECSIVPTEEVCDGIDNDCNDRVDEICPCTPETTQSCGSDIGECTAGTQTCENGHWGDCVGASVPDDPAERCDGLDNDCDMETDEGCPCTAGAKQACGTNDGECVAGTQTCVDGNWEDCVGDSEPMNKAERCDGLDNDCNGLTDEGCPCTAGARQTCGSNTGVCTAGTQTCVDGNWGDCDGDSEPVDPAETCDGLDNNCDGHTDEGCPCTDGAKQSCGSNVGECTSGTQTCVDGNWGECVGAQGPTDEVCDGKDNDCNGTFDEGFADIGALCKTSTGCPGRVTCTSNTSAACVVDEARFGDEVCDGLDNDCNGLLDLVSSGGGVVSRCVCDRRLVIGDAVDASIMGNPNLCATTRCGGDFRPRRAVDGICRPICESAATDGDGDGWGHENGLSCIVLGRLPWQLSTQCPGEPFPVGMSMAYCLDCSGAANLPYAMCQSVPRFDLTDFGRGQKSLQVDYTYTAAAPAEAPVNVWIHAGGELRKHMPLVTVGEAPGRQTKLLHVSRACFTASPSFGSNCPSQAAACDHCEGNEVCGAVDACGAYDLSQAWLQVAAEFCGPETGVQTGTVTIHEVGLVEPNCEE